MERAKGFEPSTQTLARLRSDASSLPLRKDTTSGDQAATPHALLKNCWGRFSGGEQWITTYVGATEKSNSPAVLRVFGFMQQPSQEPLLQQESAADRGSQPTTASSTLVRPSARHGHRPLEHYFLRCVQADAQWRPDATSQIRSVGSMLWRESRVLSLRPSYIRVA